MVQEIVDSVYTSEQTFDGMTVRGVVVRGSTHAVVFDTLYFPEYTKALAELCHGRDLIAIYSHADYDHVWGTCGLHPVEIIAHAECARRFADFSDVEKTLGDFRIRYPDQLREIRLMPPSRTFQSELALDLGGITVNLRHCPGHTRDSIFAIVPERSVLLAADCVETPLPLLNEDARDLDRWIDELIALERDSRVDICVPSHGKVGDRRLVSANIEYLDALRRGVELRLPDDLDAFYKAAHLENVQKTRRTG